MQSRSIHPTPRGIQFWWLAIILLLAVNPSLTENARGASAEEIDVSVNVALNGFRASDGWEAGVDGNIALITIGAGERVDTRTIKDPIVGFVFDVKGLIADLSLKGAKFTKLDK